MSIALCLALGTLAKRAVPLRPKYATRKASKLKDGYNLLLSVKTIPTRLNTPSASGCAIKLPFPAALFEKIGKLIAAAPK